jgi:G3E family GTPase
MDLYLITGFLGAGKTTFLRQFAACFAKQRVRVIVNEFGANGVDGTLLRGVDSQLFEICDGSIFCACRLEEFRRALQRCAQENAEVVLVEASGLAEPGGIRALLEDPALDGIAYAGSVCIVDTPRIAAVFETARACRRQLAVSSLVLLNKTDCSTSQQQAQARRLVLSQNPAASLRHTSFGAFDAAWMPLICPIEQAQVQQSPDLCLQKQTLFVNDAVTHAQLVHILRMLAEAAWRVKGIVKTAQGCFFVDCVADQIGLHPFENEHDTQNRLTVLAGKGMPLRQTLREVVHWYPALTAWE